MAGAKSKRRLFGIDRSGPPPAATRSDQPLHPWTVPNAIGYARLAGIPVFLVVALSSDGGQSALAAALFAVIGWADYLDGFAARLTGQYSRLGALLDPVIDRLLVISGMVVCWRFTLLPRWAIALVSRASCSCWRSAGMRCAAASSCRSTGRGGSGSRRRWAPLSSRSRSAHWLALVLLYVGLALALLATVLYVRRRRPASSRFAKPQAQLDPLGMPVILAARTSPTLEGSDRMDTFPDLGSLTDQELKELIKQLTEEEMEISYKRRILHGKIDILRAELVNRLRKKDESGELVITGADVQQLTDILAGRVPAAAAE